MDLRKLGDIAKRFSRCPNYPKNPSEVVIFVEAIGKAVDRYGVDPEGLADRCLGLSQFCPTDFDLLTVAKEMREEVKRAEDAQRNRVAEWRREYGEPQPLKVSFDRQKVRRDEELWRQLRRQFPDFWPNWMTLADAAEELGYSDYASAWRKCGG